MVMEGLNTAPEIPRGGPPPKIHALDPWNKDRAQELRSVRADVDLLSQRVNSIDQPGHVSAGRTAMADGISREEIGAKLEAVEARTDTKFAELLGEIKLIQASTAGLKTVIVVTAVATFIGLAALLIAVFAYGASSFYNGTVVRDVADHAAAAAAAHETTGAVSKPLPSSH